MKRKRRKIKAFFVVFFMSLLATLIVGMVGILILYVAKNGYLRNSNEEKVTQHQEIETYVAILETEVELVEIGETESAVMSDMQDEETEKRYEEQLSDELMMKQERIYTIESDGENEVSLLFAGDMLFDDEYAVMSSYLNRGGRITDGFSEDLIATMNQADICMVNNEFTYTRRGTPTEGKTYTFRATPDSVKIMEQLGVDIVSLANNHAMDYGEQSLYDTMYTLERAGIPYVGAGKNIEEASHPVYYIVNDVKIAFVAATQIEQSDFPDTVGATENSAGVYRCWKDDRILKTLQEAKQNSDFVVFYIHWGSESTTELNWGQTTYVKQYVDAGADLIIGDHPHVLQGIELMDGVPVIYSVGNFWFNSKTRDTCMVKCIVDKEGLKSFQFIPCLQSDCKTVMLEGEEKKRVIQYENSISRGITLDENGYLLLQQSGIDD